MTAGGEREANASLLHMSRRPCPFCLGKSSTRFSIGAGVWVKCRVCRSVFQDITADNYEQLHGEAFQDFGFTEAFVAVSGLEPASARWDEMSLPGTSLLEIGPGTGNTLAAAPTAGRSVHPVDTAPVPPPFTHDTPDLD